LRYVRSIVVNVIYRRDRYLRCGDHLPFSMLVFPLCG
jgi:hypothetical protein